MKIDPQRYLITALLFSLALNGVLFGAWRADLEKLRALQAQQPVQQESLVAPLQRPMRVYNTTPKTNQP